MKWITREKVKVDRVACPWLITRFIDNSPQFVYLPADTDWSAIADGIIYDVPHCELGHHGEAVSFQSMLKRYQLEGPALQLLGQIVQAADSHPREPHPAGEGLRWIDGLVEQGSAFYLGGFGYPTMYTAKIEHLRPKILDGPPSANNVWVCGPEDILSDGWEGKTTVDHKALRDCSPDEWVLVEAWDES